MTRILSNLTINEVSSVDKGAGEGVRIMLMKRAASTDPINEDTDMTKEEIAKLVANGVAAGLKAEMEKRDADATAALIAKLAPEEVAYATAKSMDDAAKKAFAAKTPEERAADMKKDPVKKAVTVDDVSSEIAKRDSQIVELQKTVGVLTTAANIESFKKRAVSVGLKEEDGEVMRKAYSGDAAAQVELDKRFDAMSKQVKALEKTSGVFKELGSAGGGDGGTAHAEMMAKADELRKADSKLTMEQAFSKAYTDPANAEIKKRYLAEEQTGRAKLALVQ